MTEDVKNQNVMISDVDVDSVISETEDDMDDDSLTTVTLLDNKKVKICVVRMIIKCTLTFICILDCD